MTVFNSLNQVFNQKKERLLSIYFTAGYPQLDDTVPIIESLSQLGVDFIEVGSPYNDPIADGQVIQDSANQALNNGMSVDQLFEQLTDLKEKNTPAKDNIAPLIWMGYFNLMISYGIKKFCKRASKAGISGLIVPDLPLEYYHHYQNIFEKHQLNFIFMISPFTPKKRILEIDQKSNIFIYVTSGQSTTGQNSAINQEFLKRLQSYKLKNPMIIGFNIKDKTSFDLACQYAKGAIIGSAFIRHLSDHGIDSIAQFIQSIKN